MKENLYTLITGASQGIGMNLAMQCARRRKNMVLIALPGTGLAELADKLSSLFNIEVVAIEEDLTRRGVLEEIYHYLKSRDITINTLINNAGIGYEGRFDDLSPEFCHNLLNLNITAMVMLTRLFLEDLKKNKGSRILNVGSLASFSPMPYKCVYAASKAFVYSFSRALEAELKPYGIRVCVLCPGAVPTNQQVRERIGRHKLIAGMTSLEAGVIARTGIRALEQNQGMIIPGRMNKVMRALMSCCPERIRISVLRKRYVSIYG